MLFAAVILSAVGYTLIYSGVKGDHYKINKTPVYKAPWLPFVAVFSGKSTSTMAADLSVTDPEPGFAQMAAMAQGSGSSAASSGDGSNAGSSATPPASSPMPTYLPPAPAGSFYA